MALNLFIFQWGRWRNNWSGSVWWRIQRSSWELSWRSWQTETEGWVWLAGTAKGGVSVETTVFMLMLRLNLISRTDTETSIERSPPVHNQNFDAITIVVTLYCNSQFVFKVRNVPCISTIERRTTIYLYFLPAHFSGDLYQMNTIVAGYCFRRSWFTCWGSCCTTLRIYRPRRHTRSSTTW